MAGASMNDIKSRIKSVTGTMQITKAMELVATSKLRRAREKIEASRPFHKLIGEAIKGIATTDREDCVWTTPTAGKRPLYIVIAGDRGLAGGYNANVFRLTSMISEGKDACFLPVGKKSLDHYTRRGVNISSSDYGLVSEISVGDALNIAEAACKEYSEGKYDAVYVVYTRFVSMISQTPVYEQLLPLEPEMKGDNGVDPIYCGDPEEILNKIVPQYVGGVLYSTICEALASESAARRTAMNAANKNASEIIDTLVLKYNRARQAVITQEITEIVSGSEAL